MSLMDDLEFVKRSPLSHNGMAAYERLRAFIQQHEPWMPPQQEGFGPWIEYKPGDKGPHVGDFVYIVTEKDRECKTFRGIVCGGMSTTFYWREHDGGSQIVAYCVKLED